MNFSLLEWERLIATVLIVMGEAMMHYGHMYIGAGLLAGGVMTALIILSPDHPK